MELSLVEEEGVGVIEGAPDHAFMSHVDDTIRLLEACFSSRVRCALLYPANLTSGFFDLSSGEAGAVLQKLRNYGVRLAVVCPPGAVGFSHRFGDMLAQERRGQDFNVFDTRQDAMAWLRR